MAKKDNNLEDPIVDVSEAVSKTDQLFEENKKKITTGFTIVVIIGALIYFYNEFVVKPKEAKAEQVIWKAEQNFQSDSLKLALQGRGLSEKGLNHVIDEYGSTPSGNLANLYAGISELKLGNLDKAEGFIGDFNTENEVLNIIKIGLLGDIALEQNDASSAAGYYKRAYNQSQNEFTTPYYAIKLGLALELSNDLEDAKEVYEETLRLFPNTDLKNDLKKALGGVEARL